MMYLSFKIARKQPSGEAKQTGEIMELDTNWRANFDTNGIELGLTGRPDEIEKFYSFLKKYFSVV